MRHPNPPLNLGPLPVEVINATLGTELEPGSVILSRAAQAHVLKRHPEDYSTCLPHVGTVVINPLYIGDDHRNPDKIELIAKVGAVDAFVLVAVCIEPDKDGDYYVSSFYPIDQEKINQRRHKGFLQIAKKHKAPREGGLGIKVGE